MFRVCTQRNKDAGDFAFLSTCSFELRVNSQSAMGHAEKSEDGEKIPVAIFVLCAISSLISFLIQQLSGVDNSETKEEKHKVALCLRITVIIFDCRSKIYPKFNLYYLK